MSKEQLKKEGRQWRFRLTLIQVLNAVTVRSRCGHGMVVARSRCGHGVVTVRSRCLLLICVPKMEGRQWRFRLTLIQLLNAVTVRSRCGHGVHF